jgi:4-hydroxyphenylpyruvate dioxygenase-like putative hemolysin
VDGKGLRYSGAMRGLAELPDLAARLVTILDERRVPYMIVGSTASSYYGEPRKPRGVDFVIDPSTSRLRALVRSLASAGFSVDAKAASQALALRTQFDVVDSTGGKADLIIRKERPFSREEFARKQPAELPTVTAMVATAEDTIIAKLESARTGEAERHLRDAASILTASGDRLDFAYIERWINELGLQDLWASVGKEQA